MRKLFKYESKTFRNAKSNREFCIKSISSNHHQLFKCEDENIVTSVHEKQRKLRFRNHVILLIRKMMPYVEKR